MDDRIGPYDIQAELGRGGMGVVYRAIDTRLDRVVAIKTLPAELRADPDRLVRFEREARTLAQLSHPNLAGIHGLEDHAGATYLVLEFVEGETLADRLDRGPLAADEAVELAAQIALGLEAAHEAGVVHRDIKPANIMITPEGVARVLDFGLARSDGGQSSSSSPDAETLTSPLPRAPTAPGLVLGTAAYMSPEQARGRRVDKRTDIWSFGVVVYEMLTGASPFVGETAGDSIGAVLHKSFDFDRLPAETPRQIRPVLERCLQRDRALRYRDIGDARLDLLQNPVESEHESAADQRSVLPVVLIFTAVVLGLVGALVAFMLERPLDQAVRPPSIAASVLAPDGVRLLDVEISPDGARVVVIGQVFDAETGEASFLGQAYVRELNDGSMRLIDGIEDPFCAAFSPDGRWLVFGCNSNRGVNAQLFRMPADLSGPPARIVSLPGSATVSGRQWFTWTPDNEIVHIDAGASELVIRDAGTGAESRRVAISGEGLDPVFGSFTGPFGDRWISIGDPVFTKEGYREDVLLIDVTTGEATRLLENAGSAMLVANDRLLFSRGSQIFEASFDRASLGLAGEIRPVYDGLATTSTWSDGRFKVSQSGVLAHLPGGVRGNKRSLVHIGMDFSETPWSDEQRSFEQGIDIAPDGERIAVILSSPRGLFEVWVADRERPRLRRLLAQPGFDFGQPRLTPDGAFVIASREDPGFTQGSQMVMMPFDGDGLPEVVFEAEGNQRVFATGVSADGERALVFVRSADGQQGYVEVRLDGQGDPVRLDALHPSTNSLTYAPDGIPWLIYISSESGERQMCLRRYESGRLGPEIPISDEAVLGVGWHQSENGAAQISYLRADRTVHTRLLTFEGGIRIGPNVKIQERASRLVDVAFAPNVGGIGVRFGDDEGAITQIEIVTEWIRSLDQR